MQTDERTYYEEEQRMDSRWAWFFALFSLLSVAGIGVSFMLSAENDWMVLALVLGIIILSDVLLFYLFRSMKLEIALSKKGFHYNFVAIVASKGTVNWSDMDKLTLTRSPYRSYGKKYSLRNGQVYTMNTKMGIRMDMKNGRKKFFSIKDIDAFRSSYRKLELPLVLEE